MTLWTRWIQGNLPGIVCCCDILTLVRKNFGGKWGKLVYE